MKLAALALVTTLGLGGAASAQPAQPRGQFHQLLLERFDRNHDGRLEPQERKRAIRALRRLARRLAIHERRVEMRGQRGQGGPDVRAPGRAPGPRGQGMLRRFDANGDGVLTPDEMPPGVARRLRSFDRNGDGAISPDELPARRARPIDRGRDGRFGDGEQP